MKKKVLLVTLLVVAIVASCFAFTACNKDKGDGDKGVKVAMITDYGDITDQSFNQTTYEACKAYCDANNIKFKYYKPTDDSDEARIASVNIAIGEGYSVIVMPGYAFKGTIVAVAEENPQIKFVALDVARGDLLEAKYGEEYDYNPDNPKWTYQLPSNVTSFVYQEEISGFMAGYAAVKEGYKKLGFLGGMAVPAVIRFGYGYVQGINAAAEEDGVDVNVKYYYGGQFYGDDSITARMEGWYADGTQVVFACGGGIWTSALDAAETHDGKVIGVDVDQRSKIGERCLTSAMKGLPSAINNALDSYFSGNFSELGGTAQQLGLKDGDYIGLPTDSESWGFTTFTQDQYETVLAGIRDGSIEISSDTENQPEVGSHVTVDYIS